MPEARDYWREYEGEPKALFQFLANEVSALAGELEFYEATDDPMADVHAAQDLIREANSRAVRVYDLCSKPPLIVEVMSDLSEVGGHLAGVETAARMEGNCGRPENAPGIVAEGFEVAEDRCLVALETLASRLSAESKLMIPSVDETEIRILREMKKAQPRKLSAQDIQQLIGGQLEEAERRMARLTRASLVRWPPDDCDNAAPDRFNLPVREWGGAELCDDADRVLRAAATVGNEAVKPVKEVNRKPWHPCDDGIDAIAKALEELGRRGEPPGVEELACVSARPSHEFDFAFFQDRMASRLEMTRRWLQFHKHTDDAQELYTRTRQVRNRLDNWECEAFQQNPSVLYCERIWEGFVGIQNEARKVADYLRQLSAMIRQELAVATSETGQSIVHRGNQHATGQGSPTKRDDDDGRKALKAAEALAGIPPLDKENGEWWTAVAAANTAGTSADALRTARGRKRASARSDDGSAGIDAKGRMFRRDPEGKRLVWYLIASLLSSSTDHS